MKKLILNFLFLIVMVSSKAELPSIYSEPVVVENIAFINLGTYRGTTDDGTEYQKSYFYPRYSITARLFESRAICKSYNFELTTFETLEEMHAVLNMADNYLKTLIGTGMFVDAMTLTLKSPTDWYWTKSGQKLSFALPWLPGEPNNSNNVNEGCLTFGKLSASSATGFNDASCSSTAYTFLCQRIEFSIPSKIMENI